MVTAGRRRRKRFLGVSATDRKKKIKISRKHKSLQLISQIRWYVWRNVRAFTFTLFNYIRLSSKKQCNEQYFSSLVCVCGEWWLIDVFTICEHARKWHANCFTYFSLLFHSSIAIYGFFFVHWRWDQIWRYVQLFRNKNKIRHSNVCVASGWGAPERWPLACTRYIHTHP